VTEAATPLEGYRVEQRPPTVPELRALHTAVGWESLPDDDEALARGLADSKFAAVVTAAGEAVACVRLVGDGGIYFYVQDLIVRPEHQGRGLGDRLMAALWRHLGEHAARSAFVGLMTAEGKAEFYERWGFAVRPPGRPGMALGWDPEDPPPAPGRPPADQLTARSTPACPRGRASTAT
jgi:GNAT superfamily N-acetyltransferase